MATPGLAMSYLVGKHEVMRLVADAAVAAALDGAEFSLRDVHDAVWRNGNVPMSLLRGSCWAIAATSTCSTRRTVVGGTAGAVAAHHAIESRRRAAVR